METKPTEAAPAVQASKAKKEPLYKAKLMGMEDLKSGMTVKVHEKIKDVTAKGEERERIQIFEGSISSLKRFKDDVREVESGFECGIGLENYNDIKVGDSIEAFKIVEAKRKL